MTQTRDQGLTAETCYAEENRISYQIDSFKGLSLKRSRKINKEGCLTQAILSKDLDPSLTIALCGTFLLRETPEGVTSFGIYADIGRRGVNKALL